MVLSQLAKIVDVVHPLMTTFFLKKIFFYIPRPRSTCGKNFSDSAIIMIIFDSTERRVYHLVLQPYILPSLQRPRMYRQGSSVNSNTLISSLESHCRLVMGLRLVRPVAYIGNLRLSYVKVPAS